MYLSMVDRCISQKYNINVSISLPVYITESGIGLVGQGMEISGQRTGSRSIGGEIPIQQSHPPRSLLLSLQFFQGEKHQGLWMMDD